jgi:RNA 3'-terminal phosphate cyclase (ATP)
MALRALAQICSADTDGNELGATDITYRPRTSPEPGQYVFDMADAAEGGSAGSVMLLFQTLLIPLVFTSEPSRLILRGGTHVAWSPTFDYVRDVFLPTVASMGLTVTCRLHRWGFYPNGGGEVEIEITPTSSTLTPLQLTKRGDCEIVNGRAVASNLPAHIPQRMVNRARTLLEDRGLSTDISPVRVTGPGPGAGIFLAGQYDHSTAGFAAIGKRGKPSEQVAEEACENLRKHHETGAAVDRHLADQLLLPAALAGGRSTYRTAEVTTHLFTQGHILEKFIPVDISVDPDRGNTGTIAVDGIGYRH